MGEIKTIDCMVERLTNGPKHHLFGFHDLLISNKEDTKYLCLEVDTIKRPPLPGEKFVVGYVENGKFVKVGETTALNYPQGARQQWVADSNLFTVNNKVDDLWGTDLYDASNNKLIERFHFPTHMLSFDGKMSYGLDYARLFRLGGYGYSGISDPQGDIPFATGISVGNLVSGEYHTLISVNDVVNCGMKEKRNSTYFHYLTHLCLNPSNNRLAFLHRYYTLNGSMNTRLMTVNIDGTDLRLVSQGALSHYHWLDNTTIYIFGRANKAIDSVQDNKFFSNPFISFAFNHTKKIARLLLRHTNVNYSGKHFMYLKDEENAKAIDFATDIIPTDGHPMTNPIAKDWCVNDTYPDKEGVRELMLYNFKHDERITLGKFKRAFEQPDLSQKEEYFKGVDLKIREWIPDIDLAFTRSGLHCDLHPRWSSNGRFVAFDSIHEGTRQLYRINVNDIL